VFGLFFGDSKKRRADYELSRGGKTLRWTIVVVAFFWSLNLPNWVSICPELALVVAWVFLCWPNFATLTNVFNLAQAVGFRWSAAGVGLMLKNPLAPHLSRSDDSLPALHYPPAGGCAIRYPPWSKREAVRTAPRPERGTPVPCLRRCRFRVAGEVLRAILSRVLAKAEISPVQLICNRAALHVCADYV